MFQNLYGDHKNSYAIPIDRKIPLVMSPAWLPVKFGRQGQAIVVNQASKHPRKFRVVTLNVNTLRGRVCVVVETSRRKVDVNCIQETLCGGGNRCIIKGKDTRYKLCWCGNDKGSAGVGVFVAKEWIGKDFEVQRDSDRIILVKRLVGQHVDTILCVNAPQSGLVMRFRTYSLISWVL